MNVKRTTSLGLAVAVVLFSANVAPSQVPPESQAKVESPKLAVGDPLLAFESLDDTGRVWK